MECQVIALPSLFQANVTEPLEPLLKDLIHNCLLSIRLEQSSHEDKAKCSFLGLWCALLLVHPLCLLLFSDLDISKATLHSLLIYKKAWSCQSCQRNDLFKLTSLVYLLEKNSYSKQEVLNFNLDTNYTADVLYINFDTTIAFVEYANPCSISTSSLSSNNRFLERKMETIDI